MIACTHPVRRTPVICNARVQGGKECVRRSIAAQARLRSSGRPTPAKSCREFMVKQSRTAVVVGAQWGDEGKGKIVDVLSEQFSLVARYAGGHNAGHTVIINERKFILQLIPCGILRHGCRAVIGNGVVLDPMALLKEVAALRSAGLEVEGPGTAGKSANLFVSNRAQVILPYHRMIELAAEN